MCRVGTHIYTDYKHKFARKEGSGGEIQLQTTITLADRQNITLFKNIYTVDINTCTDTSRKVINSAHRMTH